MCGDGSSRHSVGTHGMTPPVCYGRIKGGVYNEEVRSGYIFALVLCLAMLPMAAFAEDTVGAAQSSRTVITTVDELMQFAVDVNAGAYDGKTDAVVSLESDLDLSGKTWTSIGCADNDANVPHFFSGKFYGNGHTISNLDFTDAYGMIEYESYGFSDILRTPRFPVLLYRAL